MKSTYCHIVAVVTGAAVMLLVPGCDTPMPMPQKSTLVKPNATHSFIRERLKNIMINQDSVFLKYLNKLDSSFNIAEWLEKDPRFFLARAGGRVSNYDEIVRRMARRYGFDWRLISAQIFVESNFEEQAKSRCGAQGLMQIMPSTARYLGINPKRLLNPESNIALGCLYDQKLYSLWKKQTTEERHCLAYSLASYNAGRSRILDCCNQDTATYLWGAAHECLPIETRLYVFKIFAKHDTYKKTLLP